MNDDKILIINNNYSRRMDDGIMNMKMNEMSNAKNNKGGRKEQREII